MSRERGIIPFRERTVTTEEQQFSRKFYLEGRGVVTPRPFDDRREDRYFRTFYKGHIVTFHVSEFSNFGSEAFMFQVII